MPRKFKSWLDFYVFATSVRQSARFVHRPSVHAFLKALLDTSQSRRRRIGEGEHLWRAQVGHTTAEREKDGVVSVGFAPHPQERMKPLLYVAHEGRVDPKGIPCLYTASDRATAMSEVRPSVGALVSVGQFRLSREVSLIDFSVEYDSKPHFYLEEPDPKEREKYIWASVDREFSEPVTSDPGVAEYIPTQIISEYLKIEGFDGVVYKSRLGPGLNIALFDPEIASLANCSLIKVKAVTFAFSEPESTYHVRPPKSDA